MASRSGARRRFTPRRPHQGFSPTRGDGRYDKPRVFLDGLAHSDRLMPWSQGAHHPPAPPRNFGYAEDTDERWPSRVDPHERTGFATQNVSGLVASTGSRLLLEWRLPAARPVRRKGKSALQTSGSGKWTVSRARTLIAIVPTRRDRAGLRHHARWAAFVNDFYRCSERQQHAALALIHCPTLPAPKPGRDLSRSRGAISKVMVTPTNCS